MVDPHQVSQHPWGVDTRQLEVATHMQVKYLFSKTIWQLARLLKAEDVLHFVTFCTCQRTNTRLI